MPAYGHRTVVIWELLMPAYGHRTVVIWELLMTAYGHRTVVIWELLMTAYGHRTVVIWVYSSEHGYQRIFVLLGNQQHGTNRHNSFTVFFHCDVCPLVSFTAVKVNNTD